jgi:hypothetical protein
VAKDGQIVTVKRIRGQTRVKTERPRMNIEQSNRERENYLQGWTESDQ